MISSVDKHGGSINGVQPWSRDYNMEGKKLCMNSGAHKATQTRECIPADIVLQLCKLSSFVTGGTGSLPKEILGDPIIY